MIYTLGISYMGCQTCQARIHCEECEKRISEVLMRIADVNCAVMQMANKQLIVDGSIDCDTLEEALEDMGIFVS